ncbi:MAG TPA: hypothetical protein VFT96_13320 [Gemmatimonadaceae bacterium]|jgi:hypothetical protein|nr:hypothetical protein [Gemmatimonadaceae bacterium]
MPKSKPAVIPGDGSESVDLSPVERARVSADALYRAALDTWHHHDRLSRLVGRPTIEAEHRVARDMCRVCDAALTTMCETYEGIAARLHPDGGDAEWWHKANALWHAGREYLRRHSGCDTMAARLSAHSADDLGSVVIEFDLEASAVLALRHAAEAYRRTRPDLA